MSPIKKQKKTNSPLIAPAVQSKQAAGRFLGVNRVTNDTNRLNNTSKKHPKNPKNYPSLDRVGPIHGVASIPWAPMGIPMVTVIPFQSDAPKIRSLGVTASIHIHDPRANSKHQSWWGCSSCWVFPQGDVVVFFFAISERLQREGKYLHVSVLWMFTRCIYMIIIHVAVYACSINVRHTENCCMLNYALQTSPYRSYIR